jgi:hypothetical protein
VVSNIFPFHIWDVILSIDELIVFKMVKTTIHITAGAPACRGYRIVDGSSLISSLI